MKKISICLCSWALLLFASCEKKEPEPLPEEPVIEISKEPLISLEGISDNDTIRNEVKATIKPLSKKLNKIEFYLNDSLIAKADTGSLEVKWNSLSASDGNYIIKAIAHTADNRKFEIAKKISINNALLKIDIALGHSVGLTDIIITDKNGEILDNLKFPFSGKKVLYPKHYYKDTTVNVINVFAWGTIVAVKCDVGISRESTWRVKQSVPVNMDFSSVEVKFNNVPQFDYLNVGTDYSLPGAISNITDTSSLPKKYNYTNNSKLFVQLEKDNSARYDFLDIPAGSKSITPDLSNLKGVSVGKDIHIDGNYGHLWVEAQLDNSKSNYTRLAGKTFSGKDVRYFIPDISVKNYMSKISFYKSDWCYFYLYKNLLPSSVTAMPIEETLTTDINNVSCSIKGEYDYYTVAYYSKENQPKVSYFEVTSTCDVKNFKFPDISKIVPIAKSDLSELEFKFFYVHKVEDFDSKELPFHFQHSLSTLSPKAVQIAQKFNPLSGPNILGKSAPTTFHLK